MFPFLMDVLFQRDELKFEDLAPSVEEMEDKITSFLAFSEAVRSFRFELPSLQVRILSSFLF